MNMLSMKREMIGSFLFSPPLVVLGLVFVYLPIIYHVLPMFLPEKFRLFGHDWYNIIFYSLRNIPLHQSFAPRPISYCE